MISNVSNSSSHASDQSSPENPVSQFFKKIFSFLTEQERHQTHSQNKKLELLDPHSLENAMKILNISDSEMADVNMVDSTYTDLVRDLEARRDSPVISRPLAESMDQLIKNVQAAYQTIKKQTKIQEL